MHLSIRNIQAINMFVSSLSLVFLALGILVNDWVKLNIDARTNVKSHSPWAPSTIWSKGEMEVVRVMLLVVLSLSYSHNCFLGLEFTYMLPQTACIIFMAVFLTFFTGTLLFCALLMYHIKLRQGKSVYYSNYYINGNISTAYFSIFFHIASGLISLLEYQQAKNRSASETTMENTVSTIAQQSGSSIRVVSLPEHNSIVPSNHVHTDHVHSDHMREAHTPKVSQIQKRRVTWAL